MNAAWTRKRMDARTHGWTDIWMHECINKWMDGWVGGQGIGQVASQ